jgi:hypothetical protein
MPTTWQDILEVEVRTKRGGDCVIYKGRMYVRNTAPYFQIRTGEWAEYFVCASGCDDCKGRVVRLTPIDGRGPYVRESADLRTTAHSPLCLPSETKVVLRKAKQQFFKGVAISVHSSHRRSIRKEYDDIRRLLLHNRGWCLVSPFPVLCILYTCFCFPTSGLRTASLLPQLRAIVSTAQRRIRKLWGIVPRKMADLIEVPHSLTRTTFEDKPFLLFFHEFEYMDAKGSMQKTKVLAFATRRNLRRLFRSVWIFIDGTFKIVPFPFAHHRGGQLLTISSLYGRENEERLYPRVYILIAKKHRALYELVLERVLTAGADVLGIRRRNLPTVVKWERFTSDFESGLRGAIQSVAMALLLRQLLALGCHFHFVKV